MKPFYLLLTFGIITANFANAQNTFPATGNVGIGTTTPTNPFSVYHNLGQVLAQFKSDNSTSSGYAELHVLNNLNNRLVFGSIGSNYSNPDWANSTYIYNTGSSRKMYIKSQSDMQFFTGGTNVSTNIRITIKDNGNVGIGTTTPNAKLSFGNYYINMQNPTAAEQASHIRLYESGTIFYGIGVSTQALNIAANQSSGRIRFFTNGAERFQITSTGDVAIGTTDPKGYKLAVAGKVIAEEVVVKLQSQWPDYVFQPNYTLRPLSEVETHINTHGHLPEVPSAQQVEESGIGLGEMNALLLKKVEELTLYLLQKDKENSEQNLRIKELERQNQRIEELEKGNQRLEQLIKEIINR